MSPEIVEDIESKPEQWVVMSLRGFVLCLQMESFEIIKDSALIMKNTS